MLLQQWDNLTADVVILFDPGMILEGVVTAYIKLPARLYI